MTIIRPNRPPPSPGRRARRAGLNLYRRRSVARRAAAALSAARSPRHLAPHLDRLGALAGGRLSELAAVADANPPELKMRTRRGRIAVHRLPPAYREMERIAFCEYGLAALSHRGGVLDWPAAMPAAAKNSPSPICSCRRNSPVLPGLDDRQPHPHAAPVRARRIYSTATFPRSPRRPRRASTRARCS